MTSWAAVTRNTQMVERIDKSRIAGLAGTDLDKYVESDFKIRSGMCPNGHGLMAADDDDGQRRYRAAHPRQGLRPAHLREREPNRRAHPHPGLGAVAAQGGLIPSPCRCPCP